MFSCFRKFPKVALSCFVETIARWDRVQVRLGVYQSASNKIRNSASPTSRSAMRPSNNVISLATVPFEKKTWLDVGLPSCNGLRWRLEAFRAAACRFRFELCSGTAALRGSAALEAVYRGGIAARHMQIYIYIYMRSLSHFCYTSRTHIGEQRRNVFPMRL